MSDGRLLEVHATLTATGDSADASYRAGDVATLSVHATTDGVGGIAWPSVEELQAYCREHIAANKYPRIIEILATLPKGPTGKILKRLLKSDVE